MNVSRLIKGNEVRSTTEILEDPTTSEWLRQALRGSLMRDPIEAANDAEQLRMILFQRAADAFQDEDDDERVLRNERR